MSNLKMGNQQAQIVISKEMAEKLKHIIYKEIFLLTYKVNSNSVYNKPNTVKDINDLKNFISQLMTINYSASETTNEEPLDKNLNPCIVNGFKFKFNDPIKNTSKDKIYTGYIDYCERYISIYEKTYVELVHFYNDLGIHSTCSPKRIEVIK